LSISVANGVSVQKGDTIGISDHSGGVVPGPGGDGSHLHVEYAPNCAVFNNCAKQDVAKCIGAVGGSITVRDNGNIADDAFRVAINGVAVCTTTIGASNTCAVNNLIPGTATLTITAVIAPDNVGTYQVTLGGGLTFSDGSSSRSGTIPQGGTATYTINIPQSAPSS
jgi:hypothetical protein